MRRSIEDVMRDIDPDWEIVQIAVTPDDLRGHMEIGAIDGDVEHLSKLEDECRYMSQRCWLTDDDDIEIIGHLYSLGKQLCRLYRKAIEARVAGNIEESMGYENRCSNIQPMFDEAMMLLVLE